MSEIKILVKAIDEASVPIQKMQGKITGSMDQIKAANGKLDESVKKVKMSVTDTITSFAGIASGAINLYNSYDRIKDAGLNLEQANLKVDKANRSVKDAQDAYNTALEKYGKDSPEAKDKANDLAIAQDGYKIAVERAKDSQDTFNTTLVTSTISAITGVISIIGNVKKAFSGWGDMIDTVVSKLSGVGSKASSALDSLAEVGGGVGGVGAGGAEGMSVLGGGAAAIGGALAATAAVALTPLLADFVGKQEAAIEANENLAGLMTIRGGGAMATGTNPWTNTVTKLAESTAILSDASENLASVVTAVSNVVPSETIAGLGGHFQHGGIIKSPTWGLVGEAGPEAVIPLTGANAQGFGTTVNINSPLVYVAGSADERTVDLAVKKVEKILDNIILEASSSGGSSTHKRVRIGTGRF